MRTNLFCGRDNQTAFSCVYIISAFVSLILSVWENEAAKFPWLGILGLLRGLSNIKK